MALEKYEYPASGAVTASWLPTENGTPEGYGERFNEGVKTVQSSGKKRYAYESGVRLRIHRRIYTMQTDTDKTNYGNFRDTVGGQQFKFTDHVAAAHTVTFEDFERNFVQISPDTWQWEVTMREEL